MEPHRVESIFHKEINRLYFIFRINLTEPLRHTTTKTIKWQARYLSKQQIMKVDFFHIQKIRIEIPTNLMGLSIKNTEVILLSQ
jgi:hypothetical protein